SMISFHPGAAEAFERAAANLIQSVKDFGVETKRRPTPNFEIHPVANLTEADIIGSMERAEKRGGSGHRRDAVMVGMASSICNCGNSPNVLPTTNLCVA